MIQEGNTLYPNMGVKKVTGTHRFKFFIPMVILLTPSILRWLVSILIRSETLPSKRYLEIVFVTLAIQIQVAYMFFLFTMANYVWKYFEYIGDIYFIFSLCLIAIVFGVCEFSAYFNIYDMSLKDKEFKRIDPTDVSLFPAIFSVLFSIMIFERIYSGALY